MIKKDFLKPTPEDKKALKPYLRVMFRCLSAMFFSLFSFGSLGLYLGHIFGHLLLFTLIFLVVALGIGFYLVFLELKKLS